MEVEKMKNAYGMFYKLENLLRLIIEETMIEEYGPGWFIAAPIAKKYPQSVISFKDYNYYEFVSLIASYECLASEFNPIIQQLRSITYIRNKIAHTKLITDEEYDILAEAAEYVEVIGARHRLVIA